jgi:hypothetical protein
VKHKDHFGKKSVVLIPRRPRGCVNYKKEEIFLVISTFKDELKPIKLPKVITGRYAEDWGLTLEGSVCATILNQFFSARGNHTLAPTMAKKIAAG